MITNYIKIAFRNLLRQSAYSFINIFGLSFGLTCCLLIALYVQHQLSYDRFHEHAGDIYRVTEDVTLPSGTTALASATGPIGPALAHSFPEVLRTVRFKGASMLMAHGGKRFQEDHIYFTDSTVFDVFTLPLQQGDPRTALSAPSSMVLSAETAKRYFGDANPVGQTLIIDDEHPFTVTGVLRPIPPNTHLRFDVLLSLTTMEAGWLDNWDWSAYTYVQLAPGSREANLAQKLPLFITSHTGDAMLKKDRQHALSLQPLTDIHLHSKRSGDPGTPGSLSNLYLFSFIAVFILFIACINFINLTTARAAKRAREIGVRKVIGGTRAQLALQFLAESLLLSFIASLLAFVSCHLLLPLFREVTGTPVAIDVLASPWTVVVYLCIALAVGFLAGAYPAFMLSGFGVVNVLKGSYSGSLQGDLFRKGLIVFQFSISIALIAGTVTVFSQLRYMQQRDLGYDREQVLVLYFGDDTHVQEHIETVKQEFLQSPYLDSIAASSHIPGREPGATRVEMETLSGTVQSADVKLLSVDHDFMPFYNIPVVAGRAFSLADAASAFMVNESAVQQLGFRHADEIVGRHLSQGGNAGTVIGVVKDFHYASLHKRIGPMLIRMRARSLSYISFDIRPGEITAAIGDLEKRWQRLAPHRPFDFFFLDAQFDQQYRADRQFGQVFVASSVIAIVLACLGLFGLTAFTVQQRTKEIGIRKVLGAPVAGIVALLSKDFVKLVLIAIVISTPVAWYSMGRWLQDFYYRIDIQLWMFVLAGAPALLIAMLTVGLQSIRAAMADPVKSLRNE
jgi:putative ABC transport system permease protein